MFTGMEAYGSLLLPLCLAGFTAGRGIILHGEERQSAIIAGKDPGAGDPCRSSNDVLKLWSLQGGADVKNR